MLGNQMILIPVVLDAESQTMTFLTEQIARSSS
jgi:hypothetical protein